MLPHSFGTLKGSVGICSYIGGCRSSTPLNLINSLNRGFDWGNSLFQKLWTHFDNREKCGLRLTKCLSCLPPHKTTFIRHTTPFSEFLRKKSQNLEQISNKTMSFYTNVKINQGIFNIQRPSFLDQSN